MIPVTTRLEAVAREGLVPALRRLLAKGVPGVVLEAPARDRALDVDVGAIREIKAPVFAAIAPLAPLPASLGTVASADADQARAAASAIRATAAAVAPLGARSILAPVGAAGLAGEAETRAASGQPGAGPAALVAAWRARQRTARERHAVELCRALHGLARDLAPQRLLLLPGPDALGFLDPESAGWVLDDLKPHGVGLALDSGWVWAEEARGGPPLPLWLEAHGSRLGFLLVSDHDSSGCGEILPGAGRGDLTVLRDAIGKRTPRAVRPDPRASLDDVLASVEEVARRLGAVGDVVGW
jgi:sugar phosphate isomerase/epimerase